ncbi:MAG: hypothetical protein KDB14_26710 [Planctomycetales bacterium]|nr:hypothetical protein [Planctomycetales bacterium]
MPSRLPFTLAMLTALIGFGIYGETHVGPLHPNVHHVVGYSPRLLLDGEVHRLLTSLFFTAGGWKFYVSLLMFGGVVGWMEWFRGTYRTMLAFFGCHLLTLLVMLGIILPLAATESLHGTLLYSVRDVGPSAGYYGCLGCITVGASARGRLVPIGIVVLLLARLAHSGLLLPQQGLALAADVAHAIAFPLGMIGSAWLRRS